MKLEVHRLYSTDESTIGKLSIDGVFQCWTLEPRKDQSKGKPYCTPAGTYRLKLLYSNRFKMMTPHVLDVPGFTDIEIHPGNIARDTEGCTLVGTTYFPSAPDYIGQSRLAFEALMAKLDASDEHSVEYIEVTA